MQLFVSNLHNYLMVEVLEASWKKFLDSIEKARDMDEIMEMHSQMVSQILQKSLLTPNHSGIFKHLNKIFDLILRFNYTQDVLYTTAQEEYHRRINIESVIL